MSRNEKATEVPTNEGRALHNTMDRTTTPSINPSDKIVKFAETEASDESTTT